LAIGAAPFPLAVIARDRRQDFLYIFKHGSVIDPNQWFVSGALSF
jgi:hypothetical protein